MAAKGNKLASSIDEAFKTEFDAMIQVRDELAAAEVQLEPEPEPEILISVPEPTPEPEPEPTPTGPPMPDFDALSSTGPPMPESAPLIYLLVLCPELSVKVWYFLMELLPSSKRFDRYVV